MAQKVTYVSDMDDSEVDSSELVAITVTRQGETKAIHLSEDQFTDLLDESDTLQSLVFSD